APCPFTHCRLGFQGDFDAMLQYIEDDGDVNKCDREHNTPLHWACQESHYEIVGVLMSRGAKVEHVNVTNGF
ncbi:unnamed protein product, partial [Phaeothamnion confervicola]